MSKFSQFIYTMFNLECFDFLDIAVYDTAIEVSRENFKLVILKTDMDSISSFFKNLIFVNH